MLQTVSWLLPTLLLYLMTAVAAHLVMSFGQTLMHYKLGHHRMGGKFFRNHINFHHTYYSRRDRGFKGLHGKQELHFVHHRHANTNFAVIHFFWDRILGTYRRPNAP